MQTKIVAVILSISLIGLVLGTAISQENETAAMAISIAEATVCREVVDRAPVGAGDVFPNDVERLYCFVRVQGADTDIEIQHKWYYQGELVATVALPVRSDNWRTYSSKRIGPQSSGEWMVEICSDTGEPLQKIVFMVE
jgi:hypothetical protein